MPLPNLHVTVGELAGSPHTGMEPHSDVDMPDRPPKTEERDCSTPSPSYAQVAGRATEQPRSVSDKAEEKQITKSDKKNEPKDGSHELPPKPYDTKHYCLLCDVKLAGPPAEGAHNKARKHTLLLNEHKDCWRLSEEYRTLWKTEPRQAVALLTSSERFQLEAVDSSGNMCRVCPTVGGHPPPRIFSTPKKFSDHCKTKTHEEHRDMHSQLLTSMDEYKTTFLENPGMAYTTFLQPRIPLNQKSSSAPSLPDPHVVQREVVFVCPVPYKWNSKADLQMVVLGNQPTLGSWQNGMFSMVKQCHPNHRVCISDPIRVNGVVEFKLKAAYKSSHMFGIYHTAEEEWEDEESRNRTATARRYQFVFPRSKDYSYRVRYLFEVLLDLEPLLNIECISDLAAFILWREFETEIRTLVKRLFAFDPMLCLAFVCNIQDSPHLSIFLTEEQAASLFVLALTTEQIDTSRLHRLVGACEKSLTDQQLIMVLERFEQMEDTTEGAKILKKIRSVVLTQGLDQLLDMGLDETLYRIIVRSASCARHFCQILIKTRPDRHPVHAVDECVNGLADFFGSSPQIESVIEVASEFNKYRSKKLADVLSKATSNAIHQRPTIVNSIDLANFLNSRDTSTIFRDPHFHQIFSAVIGTGRFPLSLFNFEGGFGRLSESQRKPAYRAYLTAITRSCSRGIDLPEFIHEACELVQATAGRVADAVLVELLLDTAKFSLVDLSSNISRATRHPNCAHVMEQWLQKILSQHAGQVTSLASFCGNLKQLTTSRTLPGYVPVCLTTLLHALQNSEVGFEFDDPSNWNDLTPLQPLLEIFVEPESLKLLFEHPLLQTSQAILQRTCDSVRDGTISVPDIVNLDTTGTVVSTFFPRLDRIALSKSAQLARSITADLDTINDMIRFIETSCPSLISDLDAVAQSAQTLGDTVRRQSISEAESSRSELFAPFKAIMSCAMEYLQLQPSHTLAAWFHRMVSNRMNTAATQCVTEWTVQMFCTTVLPQQVQLFGAACSSLFETGFQDVKLSQIDQVWNGAFDSSSANEDHLRKEVGILNVLHPSCSPFPNCIDGIPMLRSYYKIREYESQAEQIQEISNIFADFVGSTESELLKHLKQITASYKHRSMAIAKLHQAVNGFHHYSRHWNLSVLGLVKELANSRNLVELLRELLDVDVRTMIDGAEDISEDQFGVNEIVIRDFILLHSVFKDVLQRHYPTVEELMQALLASDESGFHVATGGEQRKRADITQLLKTCLPNIGALRRIHLNMANSGEATKQIIERALKAGWYEIVRDSRTAQFDVSLIVGDTFNSKRPGERTSRPEATKAYGLAKVEDLRRRALLGIGTRTLADESDSAQRQRLVSMFSQFEQEISKLLMAVDLLRRLESWGGFFNVDKSLTWTIKREQMDQVVAQYSQTVDSWITCFEDCKSKFRFLTYFLPGHLPEIHKGLHAYALTGRTTLVATLRYAIPWITPENIQSAITRTYALADTPLLQLSQLCQALDACCQASLCDTSLGEARDGLLGTQGVQPGRLRVLHIWAEMSAMSSIMHLFVIHDQRPTPHQVLVCEKSTTEIELDMFLYRCYHQPGPTQFLHCLVGPERLPTELQFFLVEKLQCYQALALRHSLLAVVCLTPAQNYILDQFPAVEQMEAISTNSERALLQCVTRNRRVTVVTSSVAALGKTEFVRQQCKQQNLKRKVVDIAGPIQKKHVINRIRKARITREGTALHLQIGEVLDTTGLHWLLFELLVLGNLRDGKHFCFLPDDTRVFVEVANSVDDRLFSALGLCTHFENIELSWNLRSLKASSALSSPMQLACHYLQALDSGTLGHDLDIRTALSSEECQDILLRHFPAMQTPEASFSTLFTFVKVLASQLQLFADSIYFQTQEPGALSDLPVNARTALRTRVVEALIDVAREFANRSVQAARHNQHGGMLGRLADQRKWERADHLLVVFQLQGGAGSISVIFCEREQVSQSIATLAHSQQSQLRSLLEYNQYELLDEIAKITKPTHAEVTVPLGYVMSADNALKMALISLRVHARVPVILMGHTGCGKTSLLKCLASIRGVQLETLNCHAGTSLKDIEHFVERLKVVATEELEVWGFFDEINTSDHVGVLANLLCHSTFQGERLPPNIVFVGACNPYQRRRHPSLIVTPGLRKYVRSDPMAELTYRVHPLPEILLDYVWDYGTLPQSEEEKYIQTMLLSIMRDLEVTERSMNAFVHCLVESQDFLRQETDSMVSLRDVRRCVDLIAFFLDHFALRETHGGFCLKKCDWLVERLRNHCTSKEKVTRAFVVALSVIYSASLSQRELRDKYWHCVENCLKSLSSGYTATECQSIVLDEQRDMLMRMDTTSWPNTAHNGALLENVFVVVVAILNRIPVFVVGKPGNSKSLALHLVNSSLRGIDSHDPLLKALPGVYILSYQGHENSTSEGIQKVFERVKRYGQESQHPLSAHSIRVIPVLLLDEVGLAEYSPNNPLKVLHSLLEPAVGERPDVAVVGISNWALDPAKMNRAIHLSRPAPDVQDLEETAIAIAQTFNPTIPYSLRTQLSALARNYFNYAQNQVRRNFHGLRDFYSLVKCIAAAPDEPDALSNAVARNFGGLIDAQNRTNVRESFNVGEGAVPQALELVKSNLGDPTSRHLMVGATSQGILNILHLEASKIIPQVTVLIGSQFVDDQTAEHSATMLRQIILCLEAGGFLILSNLDSIYGSLYDMLNQNYISFGGKRSCRIAIGADSNPLCTVHSSFKCITLVDAESTDQYDPPFLNRFEKQILSFEDVLDETQRTVVNVVHKWVEKVTTIPHLAVQFSPADTFLGYSFDTLCALVIFVDVTFPQHERSVDALVNRTKTCLIRTLCLDGLMRVSQSRCEQDVVDSILETYHALSQHSLDSLLNDAWTVSQQAKLLVYTFSTLRSHPFDSPSRVQEEKLGMFRSEASITARLEQFAQSDKDTLVLHAVDTVDCHLLPPVMRIIDRITEKRSGKFFCVVVHVSRNEQSPYLCDLQMHGWDRVTIDSLDNTGMDVWSLREQPLVNVVRDAMQKRNLISDLLPQCLHRIQYPENVDALGHMARVLKLVRERSSFHQVLTSAVQPSVEALSSSREWVHEIACDKAILATCGTLAAAVQRHVELCVRRPLLRVLASLERVAGLHTYLELCDLPEKEQELVKQWEKWALDTRIVDPNQVTLPKENGMERIQVTQQTFQSGLKFPFSSYFCQLIQASESLFLELFSSADPPDLTQFGRDLLSAFPILQNPLFARYSHYYLHDVAAILRKAAHIPASNRLALIRWVFSRCDRRMSQPGVTPVDIHLVLWQHTERISSELAMLALPNFPPLSPALFLEENTTELVDIVGEQILHTRVEDLHEWHQLLSCLLAHNTNSSPVAVILRILEEFARFVAIPCSMEIETTNAIREVLATNADMMDETFTAVVEFITSLLADVTETECTPIRQFLRRFLSRWVQLGEHSTVLDWMARATRDQLRVDFATETLTEILSLADERALENALLDRRAQRLPADPILKELDNALGNVSNAAEPSQFAVLLQCAIEQNYFWPRVKGMTDELLYRLVDSAQIVLGSRNSTCNLLYLTSISLVKVVLARIAATLQEQRLVTPTLVRSVNELMKVLPDTVKEATQLVFLKEMRRWIEWEKVRERCEQVTSVFPWCDEFQWDSPVQLGRYSCNPLCLVPRFLPVSEAISRVLESPEQLTEELGSAEGRFAVLMALASQRVIPRTARESTAPDPHLLEVHNAVWRTARQPMTLQENLLSFACGQTQELPGLGETLFDPTSSEDDVWRQLASFHLVSLVACLDVTQSQFLRVMSLPPGELSQEFLIGCSASLEDLVLNALHETRHQLDATLTRYRCQCGEMYLVGNCGMQVMSSRCPNCTRQVGQAAPGTKLDTGPTTRGVNVNEEPGYVAGPGDAANLGRLGRHTEHRVACIVLDLLLHTCLAMNPYPDRLRQLSPELTRAACLVRTRVCWNTLRETLACSAEELGLVLIAVNEMLPRTPTGRQLNPTARQAWESAFLRAIDPILADVPGQALTLQQRAGESSAQARTISSLRSKVSELARPKNCPHAILFRLMERKSLDHLRRIVKTSPQISSDFPCLGLVFEFEERLAHMPCLLPLIRWVKAMHSKLQYVLTRQEIRESGITVGRTLLKLEIRDRELLQQLFGQFCEVWNTLREQEFLIGESIECKQLPDEGQMPEMHADQKLAFACCVPDEVEFGFLFKAIEKLVSIQRTFVERVGNASLSTNHGALSTLKRGREQIIVASKDITVVSEQDIAVFEWDMHSLWLCENGMEYGEGISLMYDFASLEMQFAQNYLITIADIDMDGLPKFRFKYELFHENCRLLEQVESAIPQVPLPAELATRVVHDDYIGCDQLPALLDAVGIILRTCISCAPRPEMSVRDFARVRLRDTISDQSLHLFEQSVAGQVPLRQIVRLYETVEEAVGEAQIRFIGNLYNQELSKDQIEAVSKAVGREDSVTHLSIPVRAFKAAVKQFMLRYLVVEKYDPQHPLAPYLADPRRWPTGTFTDEDEIEERIPGSLQLCHSAPLLHLLTEWISGEDLARERLTGKPASSAVWNPPTMPTLKTRRFKRT